MTDPVDLTYLNGMYDGKPDPWGIGSGWYEQRKRDLVLSCLPRPKYTAAFEPGCSIGAVTVGLAPRCERLLAADLNESAVATTAERVADWPNVEVRQQILPGDWPAGEFDLILLSEIGYFFTETSWAELCERVAGSLAADATVLACHWRHDFAERTQSTEALHERLRQALGLPSQSRLVDADFIVEVWTNSAGSIASRQGLV